jgi:ketosteroid isomerase-like protein
MEAIVTVQADKEAIRRHIDGLFQAYVEKDTEAIRRGHTADWKGFQLGSRKMVRGIEQYMEAAAQTIRTFNGKSYEMLDIDIQVQGDTGIVFYLARWDFKTPEGEKSVFLRSVDIYRSESAGWNQCGSNICTVPEK